MHHLLLGNERSILPLALDIQRTLALSSSSPKHHLSTQHQVLWRFGIDESTFLSYLAPALES